MKEIELKEVVFDEEVFKFKKELYKEENGTNYLFSNGNRNIVYKTLLPDAFDYEVYSYERLASLDINIPKLLEANKEKGYIIKDYIKGEPAFATVKSQDISANIFMELFRLSELLNSDNFDIDYHPKNFIIIDGSLTYLYYRVHPYNEDYNLRNHGIYYWLNKTNLDRSHDIVWTREDKGRREELFYDYIKWKHGSIY